MTDTTIDSALFQQAAHALPHGLVISDMRQAGQPIVYANPAFLALTGYALDEVLGHNCNFLQDIATDSDTIEKIKQAIHEQKPFSGKLLNYKKDGSTFWNQLSMSPIFDKHHNLTHFVGIQTDVSELVQTQNELKTLVEQDYLTGLPNRRALMSFFEQHKCATPELPLRISLLSINNLKPIASKYGHVISDELLKAVSGRLMHVVKPEEFVARFSEDSFVVLTPNEAEQPLGQRITHIHDPYKLDMLLLSDINIRIGYAHYPAEERALDDLIVLASAANS